MDTPRRRTAISIRIPDTDNPDNGQTLKPERQQLYRSTFESRKPHPPHVSQEGVACGLMHAVIDQALCTALVRIYGRDLTLTASLSFRSIVCSCYEVVPRLYQYRSFHHRDGTHKESVSRPSVSAFLLFNILLQTPYSDNDADTPMTQAIQSLKDV